ncbi:molybdate ABC transporter substrate-binding protein [Aestuariivita sp.]|uniref:molybdate ABC transporter substrate-binding protein n=1 Tax=Aestuariivita sp. TaxID=1872407 RepID=UPI003BB184D9
MTRLFLQIYLALALALIAGTAQARNVVVFAAASLKNVLDDAVGDFEAQTGTGVALSYAGSSALARQIQQGAPADIFISANMLWMDALEQTGLIRPASRVIIAGNSLVLISQTDSPLELSSDALRAALGSEGRIAMALVDAVPAGIYGKAAFETLGLWEDLAPSVVQTDNVRAALRLVALGEAQLGVAYTTDAMIESQVHVAARFPEGTHPAILYPAAITSESTHEAAPALLDFLLSARARAIFADYGFTIVRQ